jgi:hypothetical protein
VPARFHRHIVAAAKPLYNLEKPMMSRRLSQLLTAATLALPLAASAAAPVIAVYKSAGCGCCKEWIKHLEANGFRGQA